MNDILYSLRKMRMNKKVRTNSTKTCRNLHTPPIIPIPIPMPIAANAQNQLANAKTKDLKKFLKLLKKHIKKQIILKKTKILV